MVSTISSLGLQAKPQSLVKAIGDFAGGALSLKEIRQIISDELQNNPSCGDIIHEMLDEELQARRLSSADHHELIAGMDAALSENIPTETSGEAPSAPGIYRIDDEGTLVLSEDGQKFQAPTEAYDSVSSPGSKSADNSEQKVRQKEKRPEIKAGSILRDRFRLDKEIARGSMGVVYKAVDMLKQEAGAADPCVAVKLISPEFASHRTALKTFQNEIANTQHLSHPNIIHLFELDRDGDNYFITMEWLEGESLDALLDRSKGSALPPVQTYAIIEQLCDALAYAHERKVVHADVKPGNVFLVKTGELKLIDFGIARVDASQEDAKKKDGNLEIALTPAYASCEQLEKGAPTAQDDLYALACMIYRLLSGRRVFGAMHALEAEKAAIEPVRIGGMSDVRWNALRQALSFRRAYRQTTVKEFASKFGQRRIPRAVEPEEDKHTETTTLEALPAGTLESETTKLEALNETSELMSLAGSSELQSSLQVAEVPEDEVPADELSLNEPVVDESDALDIDLQKLDELPDSVETFTAAPRTTPSNETTRMEALNETAELQALAGSSDMQNAVRVPADVVKPADTNNNVMHVDTARLEAQPDFEIFSPAAQEEEVPFVDTVNLDTAPEPINIFDGDGTGFLPEQDPAASVAVPVDDPSSKPAKAPPTPKARKAKAVPVEKAAPRHKEKVTRQLGGGSQRQVVASTGFVPLAWVRQNPQLAAGSLLGIIAAMIGVGYMMSFNEPAPIARDTSSQQLSVPAQKVLPIQTDTAVPAALADIEKGEAVMVDLTAPLDQTAPAKQTPAVDDSGFEAVVVDLSSPAEGSAGTVASDPDAIPVELAQPVGMVQQSSPSDAISGDIGQAKDVPAEKSEAVKPLNPAPVAAVAPISATKQVSPKPPAELAKQIEPPAIQASANADFAPAVNVPVQATPSLPKTSPPVAEPVAVKKVAKPPTSTKSSLELHSNARKALAEGRLVRPDNDSAVYWLEQMRNEGGNVPALILIETQLANELIQRAEDTYIAGDLDAAQRWIDLAERYGANEDELTPVRSAIAKMKVKETAALAMVKKQATQSSAVSGGAGSAGQAGIDPYQTVALSNFEFIQYVEPEYPSQAIGRSVSGWVDVAFTVGKDGKPRNIQVIGSDLPNRFEAPSIAAVKRWRFQPYAPGGAPVVANSAVRLRYSN